MVFNGDNADPSTETLLQRLKVYVAAIAVHHMNMHIISLGLSLSHYCYHEGKDAPRKVHKSITIVYFYNSISFVYTDHLDENNMHFGI